MFLDKRMQRFYFDIVITPSQCILLCYFILVRLTAEDCRMHVIMNNVYGLENNVSGHFLTI